MTGNIQKENYSYINKNFFTLALFFLFEHVHVWVFGCCLFTFKDIYN